MNEPVEKSSEQSVVSRALILRAKMASDDLYKRCIYCNKELEIYLSTQATDFTVWPMDVGGFNDWDDTSDR